MGGQGRQIQVKIGLTKTSVARCSYFSNTAAGPCQPMQHIHTVHITYKYYSNIICSPDLGSSLCGWPWSAGAGSSFTLDPVGILGLITTLTEVVFAMFGGDTVENSGGVGINLWKSFYLALERAQYRQLLYLFCTPSKTYLTNAGLGF